MRKYLTEIEEHTNEITLLEKELVKADEELVQLENYFAFCGGFIIMLGGTDGTVIKNNKHRVSTEVLEELLATNRRYREVSELKVKLTEAIFTHRRQRDNLREEWRNLHASSYYGYMDEIDICNLIEKNGYINCVKF